MARSALGLEEATVLKCYEVFTSLDADGSGFMDMNELRSALGFLGEEMNDKDYRKIMEKFDQDKSGTLDFEEFVTGPRSLR